MTKLTEDERTAWNFGFHLLKEANDGDKLILPDERAVGGEVIEKPRLASGFIKPSWSELFGLRSLDHGEYRGLEHLLRVAAGAEKRSSAMQEGVGVYGGFAVPSGIASMIWSLALESSIALPRCTIFPMISNDLTIPAWDSEDKTKGPVASFAAEWLGESREANKKRPKLRAINLNCRKLAVFADASRELVQDGNDMQTQIGNVLRQAIGFEMDSVLIAGNGVAKPLGALNQPSKISVARATANTVSYADLTSMVGRMIPSLLPQAVWICSPPVLPKLLTMTDGNGNLIWQPAEYLKASPSRFLACPCLRAKKCITSELRAILRLSISQPTDSE